MLHEKRSLPLIYRVRLTSRPSEKVHALAEFLETLDVPFAKHGALRPVSVQPRAGPARRPRLLPAGRARSCCAPRRRPNILRRTTVDFGLNLRRYAHFTSPIRRYADLVVHRALVRALGLGEGALPDSETPESLGEVAAHISVTERRAMKAERETVDRLIAHHLADRIGASFQGRVSGVTRAGLFVKLAETGADGLIPIRSSARNISTMTRAATPSSAARSRTMYQLGDVVDVRLIEAAPIAGALRFELLSSSGETAPRERRQSGPQRRPSFKAHPGRSPDRKRKPAKHEKPAKGKKE